MPVIELGKATPEAVCQVFEGEHRRGRSYRVRFLTTTYAADNFSLRDDWDERRDVAGAGHLQNTTHRLIRPPPRPSG